MLEVLESNRGDKLRSRIQTGIYIMMGACLAGLAVSLALVAGFKQQFPIEEWIKFGSVALVLIIVVIGALRMRSLKADVQADPDAPVSQLRGWTSPLGMMAYSGHGAIAVMWAACDAIEITDSRIGVRFWQGDFQIIGRKMFRSDSEFDQAVTWVRAATSKCAV